MVEFLATPRDAAGARAEVDSVDSFGASRVPLAGGLRAFLVAHDEDPAPHEARDELAALVREHVELGQGVLVLTGFPLDDERNKEALVRFTSLLGEPLPQDGEGNLVREVRDRGTAIGEGARARYSDSRFGGSLHTDGAEAPLPAPEFFTLLCVRQSARGGALEFVHIRDLEAALASRADVTAALREPFHFDRRGDQAPGEPPTTRKPVLFTQNGKSAISYLRGYIERGHEHPGIPPLTDRQRAALDELDRIVASGGLAKTGKLREGELALFDNLSLLHGRTEFQDEPDHTRLLLRTWVRGRSAVRR